MEGMPKTKETLCPPQRPVYKTPGRGPVNKVIRKRKRQTRCFNLAPRGGAKEIPRSSEIRMKPNGGHEFSNQHDINSGCRAKACNTKYDVVDRGIPMMNLYLPPRIPDLSCQTGAGHRARCNNTVTFNVQASGSYSAGSHSAVRWHH